LEKLKSLNALGGWKDKEDEEYLKYNPPGLRFEEEYLKFVLDELVLKSGVDLRLHSRVVDVVRDGGRVEYLIVHGKSGLEAFRGEIIIDA